ncbi:outer membrane protein [Blastochloris tepida]|uniref:Outer membrane protein beta-barrel domain-containing protein n=1 Tax=Blastochloris tepida TaxID=2233851 RepID=A0A348FWZ2_9HYPH|nr:outer membrane beta-barrel protein [Blastochloris tepida]BBF91825.1 hypothetical protein BLTE_05100 [Blastochloris tepida]
MKRVVIGGLMCVVGLAGSAAAADLRLAKSPEVMAPAWSWTGGYIGLNGGYGWGSADNQFDPHPFYEHFAPAGASLDHDIDGGLFGFQTGWNWQVGNVVFGLEGTTAWSGIEGKDTAVFNGFGGATYKTEIENVSTFVARLGFASGAWLFYGKGGVAYGEVKSTLTNDNGSRYFRETNDHIGWTLGLGAEYALAPNWILGLEYNYIDLGDERYGGGVASSFADYTADIAFSTVLARLSYKFGAGGNPLAAALLGPATPGGLWNGLYLGLQGGYAWGTSDQTLYAGSLVGGGGSRDFDFDGGLFGVQIGYMGQIGNWVLGTEGTFAWTGLKKSGEVPEDLLVAGAGASVSSELNWIATTTLRLGYTWGPWQLYGKGGTAFGQAESTASIRWGGDTFSFSEKNDHVGWTLGGGLEYAWGNWLVGVEYNYYDLGDQKYGGDARPDGWMSYENDLSFSSVLARVSYKFNPTPAPVVAKY